MKTSKLLSLATALVLLSSTVFAGKANTDIHKNDTTWIFAALDYTDWDYVIDPLQEVLEMDAIPMIYVSENIEESLFVNSEEEYINPLEEVLAMELIPAIQLPFINSFNNVIFNSMEEEYTNPLEEVLAMEAIPVIYQPAKIESGQKVGL